MDGPQAALFMAFLRARDISGFNPRHFPKTAGLVDQQVRSLSGAAKWLYNELTRCEGDGDDKTAAQESWDYGDRGVRLWPIHITAGALYNRYATDLKPFPYSRGTMDQAQFIKDLRKILPMMAQKRETAEPRRRYWQMPTLQQAKQAFEEHLNCDDPSALWLDMATDVSDEG